MDLETIKLVVQIINIIVLSILLPIARSVYGSGKRLLDTIDTLQKKVKFHEEILYSITDDSIIGEAHRKVYRISKEE